MEDFNIKKIGKVEAFEFEGEKVRSLSVDGEPYFIGKDVAEILRIQEHQRCFS